MTVAALPRPDEPPEDETFVINANTLTLGELEELEDVTGRNVVAELGRGQPSAKTLIAVVWIMKKRADPNFTLDQARAMNVTSFKIEAPSDPKEPAG